MAKQRVTLTLDSRSLAALRAIVGHRSLSAAIDQALRAYVARARHLAAVDDCLAELEAERGPPSPENIEWAARQVDAWAKKKRRGKDG